MPTLAGFTLSTSCALAMIASPASAAAAIAPVLYTANGERLELTVSQEAGLPAGVVSLCLADRTGGTEAHAFDIAAISPPRWTVPAGRTLCAKFAKVPQLFQFWEGGATGRMHMVLRAPLDLARTEGNRISVVWKASPGRRKTDHVHLKGTIMSKSIGTPLLLAALTSLAGCMTAPADYGQPPVQPGPQRFVSSIPNVSIEGRIFRVYTEGNNGSHRTAVQFCLHNGAGWDKGMKVNGGPLLTAKPRGTICTRAPAAGNVQVGLQKAKMLGVMSHVTRVNFDLRGHEGDKVIIWWNRD